MENEIRRLLLVESETVKRLLLTDLEASVYRLLRKCGSVGSADVCNYIKLTPEYAASSLRRIYEKGYASRKTIHHAGGGWTYRYTDLFPDPKSPVI